MNRDHFGWALVGWFNLLALIVVGVIIAHINGSAFVLSGQLILGLAVATLVITSLLLWLMLRRPY